MSKLLDHGKSFRIILPDSTTREVEAGVEKFTLLDPAGGGALEVGDGTGSPTLTISKSDAGTSALRFKSNAKKRWDIGLASSENLTISRFDASEVLQDAITFNASSGLATLPAGLTVTTGNLTVSAGDVSAVNVAAQTAVTVGGLLSLSSDGSGFFADGAIQLNADGTSIFDGKLTISAGGLDVTGAIVFALANVAAYADDAAAAVGGVPVGGVYRTASALKIREA